MNAIKTWIINAIGNAGISIVKRRSPIIKSILENPENLKVETYIERDEIVVKIKKKEG